VGAADEVIDVERAAREPELGHTWPAYFLP
jgi:hypothetical protein